MVDTVGIDMLAICDKHEIGYDELGLIIKVIKSGEINNIINNPKFVITSKLESILNDLIKFGFISFWKVEK